MSQPTSGDKAFRKELDVTRTAQELNGMRRVSTCAGNLFLRYI